MGELGDTPDDEQHAKDDEPREDLDWLFEKNPSSPFGLSPFDRAVIGAILEAEALVAGRRFEVDDSAPASGVRAKRSSKTRPK